MLSGKIRFESNQDPMKRNKNKILVRRLEPLSMIVMILLVLILTYQLATNNTIFKTKNALRFNASLGTTTNGYLLVVTSFVSVAALISDQGSSSSR